MLASQLLQQTFPSLHLTDKVGFALQLMEDYNVQHLPVITDEKLIGIIAKDDLLDEDEDHVLLALEESFIKASVKKDEVSLESSRPLKPTIKSWPSALRARSMFDAM